MSHFLSTSAHYQRSWVKNTLSVPWGLHTSMASFSLLATSWHHWPSTEILCMVFDIKTFIHTIQNALQYLENHYHYQWSLSHLLMAYIINWQSDGVFLCSTSDHIFTWLNLYLSEWLDEIEDLGCRFIHPGYDFRKVLNHLYDGFTLMVIPSWVYICRWLYMYM